MYCCRRSSRGAKILCGATGRANVHLRLIDDAPAEAAWNMALDEAIVRGEVPATLRLYGWSPHAISLGYFQDLRDFADVPAGTPIVRRLTGGGAIHHGDELTWSLALDAVLLPRDLHAGYVLLHDAVASALAAVGVTVQRLEDGSAPSARPHARWCFAVPGRHDLVTADGRKLCGSAQRRITTPRGPRVLHHGSIVFERPGLTPFVAAVADATDAALAAPRLRTALTAAMAAALALPAAAAPPTAAERAVASELQRERYQQREFTIGRRHRGA